MPRREPLRFPTSAVLGVLGFLAVPGVLAGCGGPGPVPVTPPTPGAEAAAACAKLQEAFPDKVDEGKRRETSPESALTAAWRDPAVVLRCGVADPPVRPTTQLRTINDVDWYTADFEVTGPHVYTTVGRVANVELTIPDGRLPAGALVDLADAVKLAVPLKD